MNRYYSIPLVLLLMLSACSSKHDGKITIHELTYPNGLSVISRGEWGWQDLKDALPPHRIEKITIHHGGEDYPVDRDPVEYLRTLQSWSHRDKQWIDIPYHYMIDLKGNIYEARPINYPGDTNTDYDPRGHALICVMGNYENQILSEAQLNSVIALTAFLAERFDVPLDQIKGHKDYTETLCPGKDLYRYLQDGTIHNRVREWLQRRSH